MNDPMRQKASSNDQRPGSLPPAPADSLPEAPLPRRFKITRQFAIGFLGWYLVVGLIYWLLEYQDPQGYEAMIMSLLVFPAQIIALLILFLVKRFRQVGWGVLSAIAVNLLISLILGLNFNALCFIPFFAPLY